MSGNYDSIPEELKQLSRWVGHTNKKKPISPVTLQGAKANDPETWGTFEMASALVGSCDVVGVGFELGGGYIGVDLDHCIKNGVLVPEAAEIVQQLDTYTEISPSGTGLHLIYKGELPEGHCNKAVFDGWSVEMYSKGRYFTMTGNAFGRVRSLREAGEAGRDIYNRYVHREALPGREASTHGEQLPVHLSDDEVIALLVKKQARALLWNGDTTAYQEDESRADQALCNHLAFFTGHDAAQMDRLFRQSGLMRTKWDEVHGSDGRTYGEITIAEAMRGQGYYDPKPNAARIAKHMRVNISPAEDFNAGALLDFPLDDGGNGERLNLMYEGRFLKASELKGWYYWDDMRWRYDETGQVYAAAWAMVRSFQRAAAAHFKEVEAECDDPKDPEYKAAKVMRDFAYQCGNVVKIERAAVALGHINNITQDGLDTQKHLLNCKNGTVDLRTGGMKQHDREDYITRLAPYNYNPFAAAPLFLQTLSAVFCGDQELVKFFLTVCGYVSTGETREQFFCVNYGTGANGKSTVMNVVRDVLGDYAQVISISVLMENDRRGGDASPELAKAKGKRLMLASESRDFERLNEGQIKQLTGGEAIFARPLYSSGFEYVPEFKIIIGTNHKPRIIGTDNGIWRRVKLIPFNRTFTLEEQDKTLPDRLKTEYDGVLTLLVQGAHDWYSNGLPSCEAVETVTAEYRGEMDVIQAFLDECTEWVGGFDGVKSNDLYSAYQAWARDSGERPLSARKLGLIMTQKGYTKTEHSPITYLGIKLTKRANKLRYGISVNGFSAP